MDVKLFHVSFGDESNHLDFLVAALDQDDAILKAVSSFTGAIRDLPVYEVTEEWAGVHYIGAAVTSPTIVFKGRVTY